MNREMACGHGPRGLSGQNLPVTELVKDQNPLGKTEFLRIQRHEDSALTQYEAPIPIRPSKFLHHAHLRVHGSSFEEPAPEDVVLIAGSFNADRAVITGRNIADIIRCDVDVRPR